MYQISEIPQTPESEEATKAPARGSAVDYDALEAILLSMEDETVKMKASDILLLLDDIRYFKEVAESALELAESSNANARKVLDSYGH